MESHLLQMRGLKQSKPGGEKAHEGRIFYRCVDWNCRVLVSYCEFGVASFTDAWIETSIRHIGYSCRVCRIFYRCVDWNKRTKHNKITQRRSHLLQMRGLKLLTMLLKCLDWKSHLLQMRGLKLIGKMMPIPILCRIFYRCVDWNKNQTLHLLREKVASFTDAWIETLR